MRDLFLLIIAIGLIAAGILFLGWIVALIVEGSIELWRRWRRRRM